MIILYLICGFLAYGITFADNQNNPEWRMIKESEYRDDMGLAIGVGLLGPLGLLIALLTSGFAQHGFKIK